MADIRQEVACTEISREDFELLCDLYPVPLHWDFGEGAIIPMVKFYAGTKRELKHVVASMEVRTTGTKWFRFHVVELY